MNKVKTYTEEQTPFLIERLKSMVNKNMEVIDSEILGDITEEKFLNVLKGRKAAAQDCIWAMREIDTLEKDIKVKNKTSYYRNMLPNIIKKMKGMVDKNMKIIDTDINDSITEDKYLNILKARKLASEDCRWAMNRVDELNNELNTEETEDSIKQSWTLIAIEDE